MPHVANFFLNLRSISDTSRYTPPGIYEDAVANWNKEWPEFAKWGFGPSVQAERANGQHAMAGWVIICASAYAKGHGLIPDAETALNLKDWGPLAIISGKEMISNERAVILVANIHLFLISLAATICPPPFGDTLFLDPNHNNFDDMKARNDAGGYGYLPALKFGLTFEAEILNGRLAMLGIAALIASTAIFDKPMLDIVNDWVGGAYY
jgi:hypothetical protein